MTGCYISSAVSTLHRADPTHNYCLVSLMPFYKISEFILAFTEHSVIIHFDRMYALIMIQYQFKMFILLILC